jgi:hypothetical protein
MIGRALQILLVLAAVSDLAEGASPAHDEQAWWLFVTINRPARPATGEADPRAPLGVDRPVAWENWKNSREVFLANGADPGPWTLSGRHASPDGPERFELISATELPNLRHIVNGKMAPLSDPLAMAKRLIEVRINRTSFEYIRAHELYNLDGQLRLVSAGRAARFPDGAMQIKASWRPIQPEQRSHYHTLGVRRADGTTGLYGLTALNVALKDGGEWLWASFEHEENASRPDGEGWRLASRDRFACAEEREDCNRSPRGIGLEGTVWQHYRLRGTMTAYVDDRGRPMILGNSELEAGFETSASCMTCHARASIGLIDGTPRRLAVFDTTAGGAVRRGYVGLPDPAWFRKDDEKGAEQPAYQGLDFVWSLSRAKPRSVDSSSLSGGSP